MELIFSETKLFYSQLDNYIEKGNVVVIFCSDKPDEKSKIWARLRRCRNWDMVESELQRVKEEKESIIKNIISPNMTACLAGGEIILIAWIATLLAGLIFYGIYKECNIKFRTNKNGEVELEIDNQNM